MKEQLSRFVSKSIWVAIILFAIRCAISWKDLAENASLYNLYGFAGEAIGMTAILMAAYERFLWQFIPFEDVPVLRKVYTGTIKSSYDNLERKATLRIKQSLLSVHVTLITQESRSQSLSASIDEILGEKQLTYCYLNTPKSKVRHRNEVHYGTAMLCVENPNRLTGRYYTDRKTIGDMEFSAKQADSVGYS